MMELIQDPQTWISLAVLTLMEVVLGIDNIVFVTILCGRLPPEKQLGVRRLGIGFALVSRLALLFSITWVMKLDEALFTLVVEWSGKDLILAAGGIFLLYKATHEIFETVERPAEHLASGAAPAIAESSERIAGENLKKMVVSIVVQIVMLDVVFSLDSVITAVGMVPHIEIMIAAMLLAVSVMLIFAGPVGDFVQKHPSVRVLALAFLLLIGVMLVMESTGQHVNKGYIYAAMGFSLLVEVLNMRMRSRAQRANARARRAP